MSRNLEILTWEGGDNKPNSSQLYWGNKKVETFFLNYFACQSWQNEREKKRSANSDKEKIVQNRIEFKGKQDIYIYLLTHIPSHTSRVYISSRDS